MSKPSALKLEKWYFDVISPQGDVFVGYDVKVTCLRFLRLKVAASLWRIADKKWDLVPLPTRHHSPVVTAANIQVQCRGGAGEWRTFCPPVHITLLETDSLKIEWECFAPGARAEFADPEIGTVSGLGYAERLLIYGKPWRIPIETLYWGRMVAEGFSLVWIKWHGPVPITKVWLNGVQCANASVSDEIVSTSSGTLTIPRGESLRAARLGDTVKNLKFPIWRWLAKKLGFIDEKKWLCEAIWNGREGTQVKGWCIHEVATWPR